MGADEVGEDTVDGPVSEETVEKEPEPKKKKLPKGACSICEVVKKRGMVKGVCTACRKKVEKEKSIEEKEVVEEAKEAIEAEVQEEVAAEVPEKDESTAEEEVIEKTEEAVAAEVQDEVPTEEPMSVESEVTFQKQTLVVTEEAEGVEEGSTEEQMDVGDSEKESTADTVPMEQESVQEDHVAALEPEVAPEKSDAVVIAVEMPEITEQKDDKQENDTEGEEKVPEEPKPTKKGACTTCGIVKKRGLVDGVCTACRN